jgi:hypothetical protein
MFGAWRAAASSSSEPSPAAGDAAAARRAVVAILGPACSLECAHTLLSSTSGHAVHWATNSFLRQHFESDELGALVVDEASASDVGEDEAPTDAQALAFHALQLDDATRRLVGGPGSVSPDLLLHVASFLSVRRLAAFGATCRAVADVVARDERLWRGHFARSFGWDEAELEPLHAQLAASHPAARGVWRTLHRAESKLRRSRACPSCFAPCCVVPVVYGFPSNKLLAAVSAGASARTLVGFLLRARSGHRLPPLPWRVSARAFN